MENGEWRMENGEWRMVNSEWKPHPNFLPNLGGTIGCLQHDQGGRKEMENEA